MAGKDKQSKKMRIEFRKKHQGRVRQVDLTRQYNDSEIDTDEMPTTERVSGKGSLTRHRTVIGKKSGGGEADGLEVDLALEAETLSGRVLRVHGLDCVVAAEDGKQYFCAVRRLLKSLSTDQRHVVVAGDIVHFRPTNQGQGLILSIDPRHGVVSRTSRGRRHVMVSNVDQLLIVTSAAEPGIKPNLIDRLLLTAEQSRLDPVICINKVDLVDQSTLQVLVGVYSQMGYRVLLVSAAKNWGIDWLREMVAGRQSVVAGQSGVGKSSIHNAIQPGLALRVQTVSTDNDKGRHTTTTAELIPLEFGGYLVDTPGIRQFQLWDISNEEVSGLFRDLRPYVSHCRFPDCTHLHEVQCAVKDAVADGKIDPRRYDSYCHLLEEEEFND